MNDITSRLGQALQMLDCGRAQDARDTLYDALVELGQEETSVKLDASTAWKEYCDECYRARMAVANEKGIASGGIIPEEGYYGIGPDLTLKAR